MPIKRDLLKAPIIATVGHRITATMTEVIIMQNDRAIASGDIIFDNTSIIITDRITDISTITTIIIHTVTVFGCFGEATKDFKTTP